MAPDDDKPDPTVKQLLQRGRDTPLQEVVDAATAAELERWFGLPSFQQVADGEASVSTEDPDVAAVRARQATAIAAVDPTLLEAHRRRVDAPESLIQFRALIDVRVDPTVVLLDLAMIDRHHTIAEPRDIERPADIEDELRDASPQALLRDLHRPELYFEKTFETIDMAAEQTLDIVAEVSQAMRTSWKLPPLGDMPSRELRKLLAAARAEREAPWTDVPQRVNLPNRRVQG